MTAKASKQVTLKKLVLTDWRAQNRTVVFSDKVIIRGANGAGKSTLTDAFFWLLTGVDAQDRSNYDLYDHTREFTHENALPAIVEGVFDVDGVEYILKRSAKQKWVRKRGKAEYEKDKSDEYTYYVDNLAVSAKAYRERVEAIFADTDKLKLMLNVRYYQLLDWKALRKHFSDMVGLIRDDELNGDYSSIVGLIDKYGSVDKVKELLRQEINPLKKEEESIDAKIEGMKSMLPNLDGVDEAEAQISEKRARIAEIDKEIIGLGDANKPFVEKRRAEELAIQAKKDEIAKSRKDWEREQSDKTVSIRRDIETIDAQNAQIARDNMANAQRVASQKRMLESAMQQAQFLSEELARLRKENAEIKARTFDDNQVCQSCGQPLPYDRIAELKTAFYAKREADHKTCVENGLRVKENLAKQNEVVESLKGAISESVADKPLLSKDDLLAQLDEIEANAVPFESTALYGILSNQIATLESSLTVIPEVNTSSLLAEKKMLNDDIMTLSAVVAKKTAYEKGIKDVEAKERERSEIGINLARLEGLYAKCVEREREWASIVRDRANKNLHYCKVEMTELSKAGELNDICSITIDGVDVSVANTARQIVAGIDIAEAFQLNAGLNLPLFIDNAEQICDCNIPPVSNQMVLTYVDAEYPELSIENR